MDMQDGIKVCVGNYGYLAEGDLRDDWITLPQSDEKIQEFLQSRGLQDAMHEEIYISDYDEVPFGNSQLFGESVKLEDLNILAKQVSMADPDDLEKVGDWINNGNTPNNIDELMYLIENAKKIAVYPYDYRGAGNEDRFGQTAIERCSPEENYGMSIIEFVNPALNEALENDPIAMGAFDFESYGEAHALNDGVTLLADRYIPNQKGPDLRKMDPEELRAEIEEAYKAEHSEDLSNHGSAAPEKEATGLDALSVKAAEARAAVDNLKDARGAIDTHSIDPR